MNGSVLRHGPQRDDTTLIATIVAGLVFAYAGGLTVSKLKLPPLVGYLLAGVAVGPIHTGFVADQELATQLAEIRVILLMFGLRVGGCSLTAGVPALRCTLDWPCASRLSSLLEAAGARVWIARTLGRDPRYPENFN